MESTTSTGVAPVRVSLVLAALALMVANCGGSAPSPPPAAAAAPTVRQARASYDGELPPLPVVHFASARPAPLTKAAYAFAARHPDVLRHIPCFCGCERNGHGHNEDCFISRRNADGSPEWNPHGIGCGICIDVDYPIQRYFLWAKQIEFSLGAATPQLVELGRRIAAEPLTTRA